MILMTEKIERIYYYIFLSFPNTGTLYTRMCKFSEHSLFITLAIYIYIYVYVYVYAAITLRQKILDFIHA